MGAPKGTEKYERGLRGASEYLGRSAALGKTQAQAPNFLQKGLA